MNKTKSQNQSEVGRRGKASLRFENLKVREKPNGSWGKKLVGKGYREFTTHGDHPITQINLTLGEVSGPGWARKCGSSQLTDLFPRGLQG